MVDADWLGEATCLQARHQFTSSVQVQAMQICCIYIRIYIFFFCCDRWSERECKASL